MPALMSLKIINVKPFSGNQSYSFPKYLSSGDQEKPC